MSNDLSTWLNINYNTRESTYILTQEGFWHAFFKLLTTWFPYLIHAIFRFNNLNSAYTAQIKFCPSGNLAKISVSLVAIFGKV